jgi:hypothetical protein
MKTAKLSLKIGNQIYTSKKEYPVIEEIKPKSLETKILELRNTFQNRANQLKRQLEENAAAKPENKMNPRLVSNTVGHLAEAELIVFEINKRFKI